MSSKSFFYIGGSQTFSCQGPPKLHVFGRGPASQNMLFQGPPRSRDLSYKSLLWKIYIQRFFKKFTIFQKIHDFSKMSWFFKNVMIFQRFSQISPFFTNVMIFQKITIFQKNHDFSKIADPQARSAALGAALRACRSAIFQRLKHKTMVKVVKS